MLGLDKFEAETFRARIDHIDVLPTSQLSFHLADGKTEIREWVKPRQIGTPHTEEWKVHMRRIMQEKWTPEKKQQMSDAMKQLRKERGDAWRKEE